MTKKIKEYLAYRRNRKTTKREMAKMLASALPVVREFTQKSSSLLSFVIKLAKASENVTAEDLYSMILSELAELLSTSESRVMEILTYFAGLSPQEMQKILVHGMVESNGELRVNSKNGENI